MDVRCVLAAAPLSELDARLHRFLCACMCMHGAAFMSSSSSSLVSRVVVGVVFEEKQLVLRRACAPSSIRFSFSFGICGRSSRAILPCAQYAL